MSEKHIDVPRLQALDLPRLEWRDIFKISGDKPLTPAEELAMDAYFQQFVKPQAKSACVNCGKTLVYDDALSNALMGGTFTWGIANGEGYCAECGYPGRAYHRDIGPIKFVNIILQPHPSLLDVTPRGGR
jgi:hypothetical protein